ncbi:Dolichyl-phosphate-mannose-protein mannosyltransferase [Bryocella elongata]|uniref:Dolichyl-phosphate-mannose-protein mannosyltransferase n=2 Tax=Bryocella elongata TaxID=863522 RepID=A0A1H5ZBS8_9BACT|nr:Dolichyl-phosphate-mannose-protein mannosyltransferase [Bryocella elongata]
MRSAYRDTTSADSTVLPYILLAAGIIRAAVVLLLRTYRTPLLWEVGPLAANLYHRLGYAEQLPGQQPWPAIFMPPGYAFWVAAFYKVFGMGPTAYIAIQVCQIGLGLVVVLLVYKLAVILVGHDCAAAAAAMTALYPPLVYLPVEFHAINLYLPLEMACIYFLAEFATARKGTTSVFLAAVCMGGLLLFRAEALALVVIFAALLLVLRGKSALIPALWFLLISFAILAPWTIRNYVFFRSLIPVCQSSGTNLWIGNNPLATGDDRYQAADDVRSALSKDTKGDVAREFGLTQIPLEIRESFRQIPFDKDSLIRKDRVLQTVAVRFIESQPKQFLRVALKKSFYFFFVDFHHEMGRRPVYWIPASLLSLLALAGLVLGWRDLDKSFLLVIVPILFSVLLGAVVFVIPRYRIVNDPLLILCAALLAPAIKRTRDGDALVDPLVRRLS